MKIKELEKIVNGLGLECEWGNNMQVIMTIWQPHKNSGYKFGSKYYSSDVLGKKQVQELNDKFEKLLVILKKHKIKIKEVDMIENGVISQITLMVRFERLMNNQSDLNFEIEDFEDWSGGKWVDYNDVMPEFIGYGGSDPYAVDVSAMFRDWELKKHERDMVVENIDELFKTFIKEDNYEWIMNFVRMNNDVRPLEIALEKGVLEPKFTIETLFGNDEIYYEKQKEYTKVLKLLTPFKVDDLDINQDSNYRGYLPEIITSSPKMYKQVLENWEFEYDSGQRILTFLIQDELFKQFKQFLNVKDPAKYYFDDWYDLGEYFLKTLSRDDLKLTQEVFDKKWMEMEHIDNDYVIDFLVQQIKNEPDITNEVIVIKEFIAAKELTPIKRLFGLVMGILRDEHFFLPQVVEPFLTVKNLDFKQADGEVMKYLDDDHPLKKQLIANDDFVQYLIDVDKLEYLPKTVTDVFLF
jgi:hypothetical protein